MELNREQIIKALECCYMQELEHNENCPECPYTDLYPNCAEYLGKHCFSLIKELTEENERLRGDIAKEFTCVFGQPHRVSDCPIDDEIAKAKADTVRKMQERLRDRHLTATNPNVICLYETELDQIAKEMQ